jgi:hypothetical protein
LDQIHTQNAVIGGIGNVILSPVSNTGALRLNASLNQSPSLGPLNFNEVEEAQQKSLPNELIRNIYPTNSEEMKAE